MNFMHKEHLTLLEQQGKLVSSNRWPSFVHSVGEIKAPGKDCNANNISYGTTMWQNRTIDVPCISGQLGHYLQGAGQAWSGQSGILTQGISCFQVQPLVLSLQELVGCHMGNGQPCLSPEQAVEQWKLLPPRCSNRSKMTRAAPNLDGYRPNGGSQMQATGMYGRWRLQAISSNPNLLRGCKILDLKDHLYAGREGKWPSWALGTESNVSVSIASFSYSQLHNVVAPFDLHLVLE